RPDYASMVAAKLRQARLRIWIRSPSMNRSWAWEQHPGWRLPRGPRPPGGKSVRFERLSPDLPEVHRAAIDFYTDLAVYLAVDGVLFDEDAFMAPGERLAVSHSSRTA